MKTILTAIYTALNGISPTFAAIASMVVSLMAVFSFLSSQWTALFLKLDTLVQANFGGVVTFAPIALLNTFFPLSEGLSMATALLALKAVCAGIRMVKAFVPTVA